MVIQPCPAVDLVLNLQHLTELDNLIISAFTADARACANCGTFAFGLEPAIAGYRPVARQSTVNDRAQRLSPITREFSECPGQADKVFVCGPCRERRSHSSNLAQYVPTSTISYNTALVSVPYQALHTTSFIDVSYKLSTVATGYVTGHFAPHSLLQSPILLSQDIPAAHTYNQHLQLIRDELTAFNSLYQDYLPLWSRPTRTLATLPARTFQKILHTAQGRDPVTDRHDSHNAAPAILDVFATPSAAPSTSARACVGTVRLTDDRQQPVQALSSTHDVLYGTGRAAVLNDNKSVELLLLPAFFPREDGYYEKKSHFLPLNYLRHRCRQAFTAFTVQTPYLLFLRAMENARACICNSFGAFVVNKQTYQQAQARLIEDGRQPSTAAVLDKLVKRKVSDSVIGSPQFFKREKLALDAMVRDLGMPSHFLTITMNETGQHRAPEYAALDAIIKTWDQLLDWRDIPVECNRAFLMRFNHVWDNYILGGPRVLGDIKDSAIRFECQGRGSLHAHICIWLDAADAAALDRRIIAFVPADFDTETATFQPPVHPLLLRLYQHAQHKQQHRCRPDTSDRKGCCSDGHCKLGFPQPTHQDHEPVLREEKRRYKYRCPRPCDQRTVCFVPELALLFDAHVNVVKIVDEEWSAYLLKYSSKPPPAGDLDLREEDILSLGIPSTNIWNAAVAHRFAVTSIYQPAELALIAADMPIFKRTRTVTFVNIDPPDQRSKRVQLFMHGTLRPDDQMGYTQRPTNYILTDPHTGVQVDFAAVRCVAFHRLVVTYSRSQLQKLASVDRHRWDQAQAFFNSPQGVDNLQDLSPVREPLSLRFIGVSGLNLAYFWRQPRELVRFPWCDPRKNFEAFAFHLLCEHLAFSSENLFKNHFPSYAAAAIHYGIIDTFDKLYNEMAAHCKYVFASATLSDDDVLAVYNYLTDNVERVHTVPTTQNVLDPIRAAGIRDEALRLLPENLQFDPTQSSAVDAVLHAGRRGIFIMRGGPGCGKSVLARYVAAHRALADGVVLMAPTNEVARRLSSYADTVHATADIPFGRTFHSLKPGHAHLRTLATCHTIVVDEAFMVTAQNLQYILTRLSEAQNCSIDGVLAANTIVLVGDERQLPPTCKATCLYLADVCASHHICTNVHFMHAWRDAARQLPLAVNHRNPAMALKLARIAAQHDSPLTQHWVDEHVNVPYLVDGPPQPDCRMLTSHHDDAFAHNSAAVQALAEQSGHPLVALDREFHRQSPGLGAGLQPLPFDDLNAAERSFVTRRAPCRVSHLCIQAPVRLFTTVNKTNGLTTAATGTVVGFNYAAGDHRLTGVRVHLDRSQKTVSVNRVTVAHSPPGGAYVRASYWPLTLAYASTVHSQQGANIPHPVHLNLRSCFEPGLAYTALSRNTTDGALTLARPFTVHDLRVIDIDVFYAALAQYHEGGPAPARRPRVQT